MSGDIRVGIIGCGNIAAAHLNAYKELKEKGLLGDVKIVALCDMNIDLARRFKSPKEGLPKYQGVGPTGDPMNQPHCYVTDFQDEEPEVYADYREMLKRDDINAVEIYSTLHTHYPIAMDCLRAGKHVTIEKPMAVSVKAARLLCEEADKRGLVLGVAESFRYQKNQRARRWVVEQGMIGQPQYSISVVSGGYFGQDQIVANTAWRHKKLQAGGGWSVDCLVHGAHSRRYVFGDVEEVDGTVRTFEPVRYWRDEQGNVVEKVECDCDDTIFATLFYKSGFVSQVTQGWAGTRLCPVGMDVVYGSKGAINGATLLNNGNGGVKIDEVFMQNADPALLEKFFPKGIDNIFTLETLDFLTAVRNGTPMEVSGREGLMDLAICFSLLESSTLGRKVKVADVLEGRLSAYEDEINRHYNI